MNGHGVWLVGVFCSICIMLKSETLIVFGIRSHTNMNANVVNANGNATWIWFIGKNYERQNERYVSSSWIMIIVLYRSNYQLERILKTGKKWDADSLFQVNTCKIISRENWHQKTLENGVTKHLGHRSPGWSWYHQYPRYDIHVLYGKRHSSKRGTWVGLRGERALLSGTGSGEDGLASPGDWPSCRVRRCLSCRRLLGGTPPHRRALWWPNAPVLYRI